MSKLRLILKYWLPLLVWMALIFSASSDQQSAIHSSRIIGPIVRFLYPHLPPEKVEDIVFLGRKVAHLTEYAILAWLTWRLLRKPLKRDPRPWRWSSAGWALLWVVLYAASDEYHQSFVPTRTASVVDVLIDTTGGAAGLLFLRAVAWLRAARRSRAEQRTAVPGEACPDG